MKTAFRESYARDLRKIKAQEMLQRIGNSIAKVEQAETLHDVAGLKSLVGERNFFRLRVGDFRIGLYCEVEFVRVLHRKEIYRHFP